MEIASLRSGIVEALYPRSAFVPPNTFDAMSDDATIVLPGTELARHEGPASDITLKMDGFSAAYPKLEWTCPPVSVAQATPRLKPDPITIGVLQGDVDRTLGAPTKRIGAVSYYVYMASSNERKVIVAYFGLRGGLERFVRYASANGQIFTEFSQSDPDYSSSSDEAAETPIVRSLLADIKKTDAGSGTSQPQSGSKP